jgi:hypothetical protein
LSPTVRERVNQRLGELLEWWAVDYDGQVSAVVLGTRAIIVVEPTVNAAGAPARRINTMRLNGRSFQSVRITAAAENAARAAGRGDADQLSAVTGAGSRPGLPPIPATALVRHLDEKMSGFLGQLPKRAQQLLQEPFLASSGTLEYNYHYRRIGNRHAIGGTTLNVWCYLTDRVTLTYCAGVGHGYREPFGPVSWELTCWRADVAPIAPSMPGSGR